VKIELVRGKFRVSVDEREVFSAEDRERYLESGHLVFACTSGGGVGFRRILRSRR